MKIEGRELYIVITEADLRKWIEKEMDIRIKEISFVDTGKDWNEEGSDRTVSVTAEVLGEGDEQLQMRS